MPPQRTNLVLSTDIPDIEFGVFVCHRLNVEAYCGDCGDVLIELELVENCYSGQLELDAQNGQYVLVFPAASSPNMSNRISFDPKILPIILDICPPIALATEEISGL